MMHNLTNALPQPADALEALAKAAREAFAAKGSSALPAMDSRMKIIAGLEKLARWGRTNAPYIRAGEPLPKYVSAAPSDFIDLEADRIYQALEDRKKPASPELADALVAVRQFAAAAKGHLHSLASVKGIFRWPNSTPTQLRHTFGRISGAARRWFRSLPAECRDGRNILTAEERVQRRRAGHKFTRKRRQASAANLAKGRASKSEAKRTAARVNLQKARAARQVAFRTALA